MRVLAVRAPARGHVAEVLRSELCKLISVRSTYWALLAAVLCNVGLAAVLAIFVPGQLGVQDKQALDTVRVSLGGIHLSQVAFGVLGVLVIAGEYTSGMIRTSLSAVPQRRLLLAAKLLVFTGVALVVGVLSSLASYAVFEAVLTDDSLATSLGDPGVLRAVVGGGLFLTVLGVLGLGLGAVLRSSTGAIATLLSMLLVPSLLLHLAPQSWRMTIGPYAPMDAGGQIYTTQREAAALSPWAGFAVFCAYALVVVVIAFVLTTRRDA